MVSSCCCAQDGARMGITSLPAVNVTLTRRYVPAPALVEGATERYLGRMVQTCAKESRRNQGHTHVSQIPSWHRSVSHSKWILPYSANATNPSSLITLGIVLPRMPSIPPEWEVVVLIEKTPMFKLLHQRLRSRLHTASVAFLPSLDVRSPNGRIRRRLNV